MVMPDCSLVVTIFSRHSWPLQRIATRVISTATCVDEVCPVGGVHGTLGAHLGFSRSSARYGTRKIYPSKAAAFGGCPEDLVFKSPFSADRYSRREYALVYG